MRRDLSNTERQGAQRMKLDLSDLTVNFSTVVKLSTKLWNLKSVPFKKFFPWRYSNFASPVLTTVMLLLRYSFRNGRWYNTKKS